jgi:hypothetical protein
MIFLSVFTELCHQQDEYNSLLVLEDYGKAHKDSKTSLEAHDK